MRYGTCHFWTQHTFWSKFRDFSKNFLGGYVRPFWGFSDLLSRLEGVRKKTDQDWNYLDAFAEFGIIWTLLPNMESSICYFSISICYLSISFCYLSISICRFLFDICQFLFAICRFIFAICQFLFALTFGHSLWLLDTCLDFWTLTQTFGHLRGLLVLLWLLPNLELSGHFCWGLA